jgi:hypothetical protein
MFNNMFTADAQQQALGFLVSQTSYIEPQVYKIKYPELNYRDLVPIDTSASEWAKSVTFFSVDMVGRADWFNHLARDVPLADITRGRHEVAIEMAAVGYRYTLEELGQAMMVPNVNLTTDRAAAAKRAYEEFVYNKALWGAVEKNWLGLLNHSAPTVINAQQTWAYQLGLNPVGTTPILNDINGVLSNIWQASMTVETADTLLLPLKSMAQLAITQLPNTTMNLMEWIAKNNMFTQTTQQRLNIIGVRGLDTAGASGNARAVAYRKDPDIVKMHIPMPHRFLPVWQTGPMVFDIPGVFRLAGVEIRRPMAFRYVDGI